MIDGSKLILLVEDEATNQKTEECTFEAYEVSFESLRSAATYG